ncbi:GNAT family N-acetyltransferase [Erythrobacter sp. SCSIO 43205]|uniref:GNAT family N-acetyltransferase n=1 Tax=Erythrobacter sp. SCSIO 43205 TaxID=2779361 RepID=UPI001CA9EB6C|nr:GNAT family N-acetyltransferase [Erythrobacter sp. SCSIO 43205]UAB77090.1 GNAT family N-acetyltransferase [Erythrobacter sp. SCSIO 43205]
MGYTLRPFEAGDAPALSRLTLEAIVTTGAKAYSQEQVNVWAEGHLDPQRFLARAKAGDLIYVMADATNAPAAYALLEPDGHLDMLYCAPEHAGRGLAGRLLFHAEMAASERGIQRLYTEASELARSVFERAGYQLIARRDFGIRGVAIHNYSMEKML